MVERHTGEAAYVFIKRKMKSQIESGELSEGSRVPSELEVARQYGVSRNPARQALRDLEREGYLIRRPGIGSFVAPAAQRQKFFALSGNRTMVIASPGLESEFNRNIVGAIIKQASEFGYLPALYFQHFSEEQENDFLTDIQSSGVAGLILWLQNPSARNSDLLHKFQQSRFAYVLIDRFLRDVESDFVVSDNEEMGYRLTRAILERGHEYVAFVSGKLDSTSVQDRLSGYRRALEGASRPVISGLIESYSRQNGLAPNLLSSVMSTDGCRPTAFVCENESVASSLIDELEALYSRIPSEIELATVDDVDLAATLGIPMITATQAAEQMGRESAELLIARIANPDLPSQQRYVKATYHDGLKTQDGRSASEQEAVRDLNRKGA